MSLLAASKNNWKWLKNCYDYQGLKNVRRVSFRVLIDKIIMTKVARIVSVIFQRKIKKPISMFEVFSLVFFSILLCSFFFFFSFVIVKAAEYTLQYASNENKIITMTSWRNRDIMLYWIFPKLYTLELSRIYSFHFVFQTCKITFGSLGYLYSHKTQFSPWWCWLIWLSRYAFFRCFEKD